MTGWSARSIARYVKNTPRTRKLNSKGIMQMNLLKRIAGFFGDVRSELKKVHWPSQRELAVYFAVVITTILAIGVFFWGIDYGLTTLLERFVLR
ncbi:MAG: preprotein translocase subunit SecE [Dethiobacteria bacterium]